MWCNTKPRFLKITSEFVLVLYYPNKKQNNNKTTLNETRDTNTHEYLTLTLLKKIQRKKKRLHRLETIKNNISLSHATRPSLVLTLSAA